MTTLTVSLDLQYSIEALGAVRVTPSLSNFDFNRKVSVNMK